MKWFTPKHLRTRLVMPFGLLVIFSSIVGMFFLSRQIVGSLEERDLAVTADAATRAQLPVSRLEQQQLADVRAAAADPAVADALSRGDRSAATTALAPLATRAAAEGRHVAAFAGGGTPPFSIPANWGPLQSALRGTADATGDKYSGILAGAEPGMAVVGPVFHGSQVVGAVLSFVDARTLTESVKRDVLFDAALLTLDGDPLASTMPGVGTRQVFGGARAIAKKVAAGTRVGFVRNWAAGLYTVSVGPIRLRGSTAGLVAVAAPRAPTKRAFSLDRGRVLLIFAGGLLGVLLVGLFVARRIAKPVNALAAAAAEVADGSFGHTVTVSSADEIGALAVSFNRMSARLSQYNADQQQVIDRLREIDKAKSELVANVSHELRTPLTSIKGAASTLRRAQLDETSRQGLVAMILDNGDRLHALVNRLILATVVSTAETPVPLPVNGKAGVMLGVNRLDLEARRRVHVEIAQDLPALSGVDIEFEQVAYELADNACKFSDGPVLVSLDSPTGGAIRLAVQDAGSGIPVEHHAAVFEQFHQLDGTATRSRGGLGLGLWLVAGLVERVGGGVQLHSAPGAGTRVECWYQTAARHDAQDHPPPRSTIPTMN